jgi:hypothetical protein
MATLGQDLRKVGQVFAAKVKGKAAAYTTLGLLAVGAAGCSQQEDKNAKDIAALQAGQSNTVARVDGLTREVGEVRTNMAKLTGLVFSISTNVTGMRAEVGAVKNDVATVQQGLVDLRADLNNELANIRNEIAASEARTLGAVTNYAGRGTAVVLNSAGHAVVTGQAIAPGQVMIPVTGVVSTPGIQLLSPGHAIPGTTHVLGVGQYATPMPSGGHLVIDLKDPGMRGFVRSRQVFFVTSRGAVCDVDGYNSVGLPFVKLSEMTAYHRAHKRLAAYAQNRKVRVFCEAYERNGR